IQRLGALWSGKSFGISGAQSDAVKTNQVDALVYRRQYNYVVYLAGINDLIVGGLTGPQAWGNTGRIKAALDELTADSTMRVVAGTLTPPGGYGGWTGGWNSTYATAWDYVNSQIRAYTSANNNYAVADFATLLVDPTTPYQMRPSLTLDGLHPNQAGSDLM